jgi:hypothetical protein
MNLVHFTINIPFNTRYTMSTVKAQVEYPLLMMRHQNNFPTVASQSVAVFSMNRQLTFGPQSTHRVAIADFRRIFHHDGKISPLADEVGECTPTPFHSIYHARTKLQCTLQLRGKMYRVPLFHLYRYIFSVVCTLQQRVLNNL